MPIGSLVPNTPTPVTPDSSPTRYTSVDGPAVNDLIIAEHVLVAMLMALNVQEYLIRFVNGARVSQHIVVSTSDMQDLTGVGSGDVCYVSGVGFFQWQGGSSYGLNEPFIYPATGMGHGAWVNDLQILLSTPTDSQINPVFIGQSLLAFGHAALTGLLDYSNSSSTPSTIVTTTISVSGFAGKTLRLSISGMVAKATGSYDSSIDAIMTFNDSGPTSHTAGQLSLPTGLISALHLGYDFVIPTGATTCAIKVEGVATTDTTLAVKGQTNTQWLQWSIIDIPA
jgi:hypothetical protein